MIQYKDEKVWVSQKAIIYNENGEILTIRRSETAPSRPLKWDLPGGTLGSGENVKEGIIREIKEETGLDVEMLTIFDIASGLDDRNEFWVTICYTAKASSDKLTLSFEHDDFKWILPAEFLKLESSERNSLFVENFNYSKPRK
jgi:8-oxo-dGTP diphosphatase